MKERRLAREFALQILFLREFSPGTPVKELVHNFLESFTVAPEASEYGLRILMGLDEQMEAVDESLENSSKNWTLQRMSTVDRNLLRIATYEISFMQPRQVPSIAINEAVELAKKFGSQDSPSFINGVLDRIAQNKKLQNSS